MWCVYISYACVYTEVVCGWYSGMFQRKSFDISSVGCTSASIMCNLDYYYNSD